LSELVQLRLRKQIDDKFYNKEYARITEELESVSQEKNKIEMEHLDDVKYKDKLDAISFSSSKVDRKLRLNIALNSTRARGDLVCLQKKDS